MNPLKYAVILAVVTLAATGCSSGDPTAEAQGSDQQGYGPTGNGAGNGAGNGGGAGQRGPGGAAGSGKVAAVSGSTAQVQNQSGQVAVTWTAATTFSQLVTSRAAALKVGDCVVALPAATPGSDEPDSGTTDPETTGTETTGPVAAATVRITAPVDGTCTGGQPGGRPAGGPSGGPSGGPNGEPGDRPTQRPGGADEGDPGSGNRDGAARPGRFGAFGQVTAISGSGFTVDSSTLTEVTTTAATTWMLTRKATAKVVTIGQCVTSIGSTDSTGALAAVSITVSAPVNGECVTGFGAGRPGRGAAGQDPSTGQDS